jgi:hypothetical protein
MALFSQLKSRYNKKIQEYRLLFNQTLAATMNGSSIKDGVQDGLDQAKEVNN